MFLKRSVTIVLLLSFMTPSMPIYAEESIFAVSLESEGKLLVQEGLLVVIDKEEFKQFIRDADISNVYNSLPLLISSLATFGMLIGTFWVLMDLRALRRTVS